MKRVFVSTLTSMTMLLVFSLTGYSQKKMDKKVYAKTVEASRGPTPIIKSDAPDSDVEEPESRGSGSCKVSFSNYTGYYINIYVDGYYRGQLSPRGGGTVLVNAGYTSIYCITAGKTQEWTDVGNCRRVYTFKLYP